MTEEQYAIDYLKKYIETDMMYENRHYKQIKLVLNLIKKQDTEINKLNNVIDRMAETINKITTEKYKIKNICEKGKCRYEECHEDNWENCIKEYFMKEDK